MMKLLSQKEEIADVLESISNKKAAWPDGVVVCMIMFLLFVSPYFTYFYDKRLLRDQRTESVRQPLHNLRKMSRISLCVSLTFDFVFSPHNSYRIVYLHEWTAPCITANAVQMADMLD